MTLRAVAVLAGSLALAGAAAPLPAKPARPARPASSPAPRPIPNREPFSKGAFVLLPLGSITPSGWLRRQLEIQARGLTGHLDEIWPDVGPNSGWLGGTGESWERGPYYLDGLLPLAYLLDDEALIAKAQRYVEWTLTHQAENGWIGPASNTDWWPNMVMLKVLTQYQEATGDPRVVPALTKYFAAPPAGGWPQAAARVGRLSMGRRAAERHLALQPDCRSAAADAGAHPAQPGRGLGQALRALRVREQDVHARSRRSGRPTPSSPIGRCARTASTTPWRSRRRPSGRSSRTMPPIATPCCRRSTCSTVPRPAERHVQRRRALRRARSVPRHRALRRRRGACSRSSRCWPCEATCRWPIGSSGSPTTRCPATLSPDMWAHQYDQQANQVLCSLRARRWVSNGPESNLFGLEPNFGCCTANMHQGWPKLVASLWMASPDEGLAAVAYGPEPGAGACDARAAGDDRGADRLSVPRGHRAHRPPGSAAAVPAAPAHSVVGRRRDGHGERSAGARCHVRRVPANRAHLAAWRQGGAPPADEDRGDSRGIATGLP